MKNTRFSNRATIQKKAQFVRNRLHPIPPNPVNPASSDPDDSYVMVIKGGAMDGMTQTEFRGEILDIRTLAGMG